MDVLQDLLDQTDWPMASAFLLGLMTALSPCPLTTNITAVGYIGRELENRHRVLLNGIIYTLGRMMS
jgi:cytochrome c biogenesis protein CcdA